jgi:His-Xaa-Ser system protein HxsD
MRETTVTIDLDVYRTSAVKKAAYRLGDRCSAKIETLPGGRLAVTLKPKSETIRPEDLEAAFLQEVLDQDLRETIAQETERVRNLLMAHAFSGLSAGDEASESADHRDDPLGIGRSQAEAR